MGFDAMAFTALLKDDELAEGQMRTVHSDAGRIALARVQGQVYAFQDLCTHDDGPLAGGALEDFCVVCPRHGARFDIRSGAVLEMPATEDIEVFAVRVAEGMIEVDLV